MANTLILDVVDSEKQIFSGNVEYLVAPAAVGEIGIYPNHAPIISKLKPGVLRLQIPEKQQQMILAISGGFLEVQNNHATILADIVQRTDELDIMRLEEQKAAALARIKSSGSTTTSDVAKAQVSLEIAIAQLKAVDFIKKQSKR